MVAQGRVGSGGKSAKKRIPTEKQKQELIEAYKRLKSKGVKKITQEKLAKEAILCKSKAGWYLNNCEQPNVLRLEDKRGEQG